MDGRVPVEANGKTRLSISEYLQWEEDGHGRHEFLDGEMYAMPGVRAVHNIIVVNLLGYLTVRLRNHPVWIFGSDQRLHIPSSSFFTYPDILLVNADPLVLQDDRKSLLNPGMLIEVSSDATHDYDTGPKFDLYREIPSLEEYIVVDSGGIGVDAWYRDAPGDWQPQVYHSIDDRLPLRALDLELPLAEIYGGTHLAVN